MLVVVGFMREVGVGWLHQRFPVPAARVANHPWSLRLASGLTRLQKVTS
jgi:hypothetical protein